MTFYCANLMCEILKLYEKKRKWKLEMIKCLEKRKVISEIAIFEFKVFEKGFWSQIKANLLS